MSELAWINNMRILTEAGCSEKGARLACDMLMSKESLVKENEELKARVRELEIKCKDAYDKGYLDAQRDNYDVEQSE